MKKYFALLTIALALASCTKETTETIGPNIFDWREATPLEINNHYLATYSVQDVDMGKDVELQNFDSTVFNLMYAYIAPTHLWEREAIWYVTMDEHGCALSVEEKIAYLDSQLQGPRNNYETELETIARKNTGSVNVNGGQAYWDCSGQLLAQTIAQLGTAQDFGAINNFYNAGISATQVTLSDVLRAANGFNNTAFNAIVEIIDLVFELEVSGDGNYLIGAVIVFNGIEYLFSSDPNISTLGPLIYDPQDGGMYVVGPMPGGITSINVTGVYEAPQLAPQIQTE